LAQMARIQAELNILKERANAFSQPEQPVQPAKPGVSTTRRKVLRRLAGGLLAGAGIIGAAATLPGDAEAKFYAKVGRVGAVIVPDGDAAVNDLYNTGNPPIKYGLVALSGTGNYDLSNSINIRFSNTAIFAVSNDTGIYAKGGQNGVIGFGSKGVAGYGDPNFSSSVGVFGQGPLYGVQGTYSSSSIYATGVQGEASYGTGVNGISTHGVGVLGTSTTYPGVQGNSTSDIGVYGNSASTFSNTAGVKGRASGNADYTYGVYGTTDNIHRLTAGVRGDGGNIGVWGYGTTGGVGVYGSSETGAYAGLFEKNILVSGFVYAGAKPFKIDHPLDPAHKYLHHIAVESPDMTNLYNGLVSLDVQGEATVEMPDWFEALNTDFRYQLTCLGSYAPVYISEKIKDRKFKIGGGQSGQEVSWQVTGIRQDAWAKANPIPVEEDKNEKEKGLYLHPEVFGQPREKSISSLMVK
jgi:hypothetical protein